MVLKFIAAPLASIASGTPLPTNAIVFHKEHQAHQKPAEQRRHPVFNNLEVAASPGAAPCRASVVTLPFSIGYTTPKSRDWWRFTVKITEYKGFTRITVWQTACFPVPRRYSATGLGRLKERCVLTVRSWNRAILDRASDGF